MAKRNQLNEERRARLEEMRKAQERKERLRSLLILGPAVLIVIALIGAAGWVYVQDKQKNAEFDSAKLEKIGVPAAKAGCAAVKEVKATGSGQHIPDETQPIPYPDAPPAFGPHYPTTADFARKFYTAQDRPALGHLVHNLEHGYNIVWYDETAAKDKDQLKELEAISKKFPDTKFIVAPWTAKDGKAFEGGKHIAFSHWYADPEAPSDATKQKGVWQYCSTTSGEAVANFVNKYPFQASPEPNAG